MKDFKINFGIVESLPNVERKTQTPYLRRFKMLEMEEIDNSIGTSKRWDLRIVSVPHLERQERRVWSRTDVRLPYTLLPRGTRKASDRDM